MHKTKNILILYFLAILISLFVSLPLFQDYLKERATLAMEKKELEREGAYVEEIIRAKNELVPYDSILADIQRGLPSDPSLPSLIRHLEELTIDSGLQIASIGSFSTIELPERPGLKETTIEMKTVSNSYDLLKGFIRELERSIRLINISSATIAPVVGEEDEIRFSLSLSLKTYSY